VVTSLSVSIRPDEIGAKPVKNENGVNMSTLLLIIVIAVVCAVVIAAVVGYVMSKKVATVKKDMAAEQEVAEIRKLVEESKTTGANVDEAEALINQFEGR
jgi:flagellar basal body-associated protein FliL